MNDVMALRPELLVVVNAEDQRVRVYLNTPEAESALNAWLAMERAHDMGRLSPDTYMTLDEYMDHVGIQGLTTRSYW